MNAINCSAFSQHPFSSHVNDFNTLKSTQSDIQCAFDSTKNKSISIKIITNKPFGCAPSLSCLPFVFQFDQRAEFQSSCGLRLLKSHSRSARKFRCVIVVVVVFVATVNSFVNYFYKFFFFALCNFLILFVFAIKNNNNNNTD